MDNTIIANIPSITTDDIAEVLHRSEKSGNRKPPIFLGIYGIGKSHQGLAFATKSGRQLVDYRLPYRTFNDIRGWGIPNRERGVMEWLPDEDLPQDPNGRYALHMEEITNALPAVQKVATELLLERRVGKYSLPKDTIVFASGNRTNQKTGAEKLMAALVDRLSIYHVRPDLDSFMGYMQRNGKSPEVQAFLSSNPTATYDFDLTKWDGESNFPTFRSYERLDELCSSYSDTMEMANDRLFKHHAIAQIGVKQGEQFAQFIKLASSIGDVEKMIEEADTCAIPSEIDIKWLVACRIIVLAKRDNIQQVLTLAHRLTDPDRKTGELQAMEAFVGGSISKRKPEMDLTRPMIDWKIKHGKALTGTN